MRTEQHKTVDAVIVAVVLVVFVILSIIVDVHC
jgi:hypothetical protein